MNGKTLLFFILVFVVLDGVYLLKKYGLSKSKEGDARV
jgi:hypothetical protein